MIVGCAISALALIFLLQQVRLDELWQVLIHAQPLPIVLLIGIVLASLLTRAARWQVYFLPSHRVPFGPLFGTLSISYFASTFLPLRAGELVRAVFLGQREKLGVPRVVGTILLEKLFDFLALGVMLVILLVLTPPSPLFLAAGGFIATAILGGFGFVVGLAIFRQPTLHMVGWVERHLPWQLGPRLRLQQSARQFAQGTDSLRDAGLWLRLLGWTAATWLCSYASMWATAMSLNLNLSVATILFVIVLTSSGQAVPSSPGYVGVYHLAARTALVTFGVDQPSALAFAALSHAFSYGTLVVVGLIALWSGGYSLGDVMSGVSGRASGVGSSLEPLTPAP